MPASRRNPRIKAIFFDFMGTCLDWHTSVLAAFPTSIPRDDASSLAIAWRHTYFASNAARLAANLPPENIDTTLRNTLLAVLDQDPHSQYRSLFLKKNENDNHNNHDNDNNNNDPITNSISAFHSITPWPDVPPAISTLQSQGYETFVFANGCRSSGLRFDMLFSSELLGVYKPARESYERVLDFVEVRPEESVMVAAHAYDVRGAKAVGMRTVYVRRWTDDVDEMGDEERVRVVKGENDAFLGEGGMEGLVEALGGL